MGHVRSVVLPDDLAPPLRAAVLDLLAQVPLAPPPPPAPRRRGPTLCYFCGRPGRMGGHHLVSGDDSSVVAVHASCHRKHHDRSRRLAERTA